MARPKADPVEDVLYRFMALDDEQQKRLAVYMKIADKLSQAVATAKSDRPKRQRKEAAVTPDPQ